MKEHDLTESRSFVSAAERRYSFIMNFPSSIRWIKLFSTRNLISFSGHIWFDIPISSSSDWLSWNKKKIFSSALWWHVYLIFILTWDLIFWIFVQWIYRYFIILIRLLSKPLFRSRSNKVGCAFPMVIWSESPWGRKETTTIVKRHPTL